MKKLIGITICIALPPLTLFICLFAGLYGVEADDVIHTLYGFITGKSFSDVKVTAECWSVVTQFRLPRLLAAAVVGASLSVSGGAYQGIFRNPLVSPGLLGVSAGAGFGAALSIIMMGDSAASYVFAFIFGAGAVILSYKIAGIYKDVPAIMLVLGGTIVTSLFNALISLIKYIADTENQLPAIVFWLMGSLSAAGWKTLWAVIPALAGIIILLACSWNINVMAVGEREARTLGIDVARTKLTVITGATLATAAAVCMSGIVGWIGLIIPHISRMLVGHDARRLLPVSISVGSTFMIIIDTISRTITSSELPLSILTSLIGAPFFIFLLKRTKGGGWM